MKEAMLAEAKKRLLGMLSRKGYFSKEAEKALVLKGTDPEIAKQALTWAIKAGYIQDEEWLEAFVRVCQAKRMGPQKIASKMVARGVPYETAAARVKFLDSKDQIRRLLLTTYAQKSRDKQVAALLRRGFDYQQLREVLHENSRESE